MIPYVNASYETGIVNTNGWADVALIGEYTNPVVVAYPREGAELDMDREVATAIVANVSPAGFRVQLRNEGSTVIGNVSYIVAETGAQTLSNGILLQAGSATVTNYDGAGQSAASYYAINFPQSYQLPPTVIASPQESSANDWLAVRYETGSLSNTGITLALERDQAAGGAPIAASPTNTIGWISINQTSSNNVEGSISTSVAEDPGSANWETVTFTNTYTEPLFFAIGEQNTGSDPTTIGRQNLASTGVDIRHTEDRAGDAEQDHAVEDILWAVFESGIRNSRPTPPTSITCDQSGCDVLNEKRFIDTQANGSTDLDGDAISYEIQTRVDDSTTTPDQEGATQGTVAIGGNTILGESGSVSLNGSAERIITFQNTYSTTPYVFATPATDNLGDENANIAVVQSVNETHLNITLCKDAGLTTCAVSSVNETIHYIVIDPTQLAIYDWIDVGTVTGVTNGGDTPVSFSKTFSNTPYIFAQVQNYTGAGIAPHAWAHSTGASGTTIIGCEHPGTANACGTGTTEEIAYLAIDPSLQEIDSAQTGTVSVTASQFTAVTFSPGIINPIITVLQNSDNGGEDPQYPLARNVVNGGAEVRYCEQDAAGVCHTHTAEDVMWMALPQGDIFVANPFDIDATGTTTTYLSIGNEQWSSITSATITIGINEFEDLGTQLRANNPVQLEVRGFNGTGYELIDTLAPSGTGPIEVAVTDSDTLTAWQSSSQRSVQLTPVGLDYWNATVQDRIEWENLTVSLSGTRWNILGTHGEGGTIVWDTVLLEPQSCVQLRARATDSGTNMFTPFFTTSGCLELSQEFCTLTYQETVAGTVPGEVRDGEIAVLRCRTITPIRENTEVRIEVDAVNGLLRAIASIPRLLVGPRMVVYP